MSQMIQKFTQHSTFRFILGEFIGGIGVKIVLVELIRPDAQISTVDIDWPIKSFYFLIATTGVQFEIMIEGTRIVG